MRKKSRVLGFVLGILLGPIGSIYINWRLTLTSILAIFFAQLICFDWLGIPYLGINKYLTAIFFAVFYVFVIHTYNECATDIDCNKDEITLAEYNEFKKGMNTLYSVTFPSFVFDWVLAIYVIVGSIGQIYHLFVTGHWIRAIIVVISIPLLLAFIYQLTGIFFSFISLIFIGIFTGVRAMCFKFINKFKRYHN